MAAIHLRKQIVFRAPTRVGLLADVTDRLLGAGVNVLAIRGYDEGDTGVLIIYPDDSRLAFEALATIEGDARDVPMIVAEVPNVPGELAKIAGVLANANLNVSQLHATTTADCTRALVVIETSNDVAAMDALQRL